MLFRSIAFNIPTPLFEAPVLLPLIEVLDTPAPRLVYVPFVPTPPEKPKDPPKFPPVFYPPTDPPKNPPGDPPRNPPPRYDPPIPYNPPRGGCGYVMSCS